MNNPQYTVLTNELEHGSIGNVADVLPSSIQGVIIPGKKERGTGTMTYTDDYEGTKVKRAKRINRNKKDREDTVKEKRVSRPRNKNIKYLPDNHEDDY